MTFNPATGLLTGTPAASTGGSYTLTFTANNSIGTAAGQSFTLTVDQAPAITSANNATFVVGQAGSFTVTATGFPNPKFSESGKLPSGLKFDASTGVLSGTPGAKTAGIYNLTFIAKNSVATVSQTFSLTIESATPASIATPTSIAPASTLSANSGNEAGASQKADSVSASDPASPTTVSSTATAVGTNRLPVLSGQGDSFTVSNGAAENSVHPLESTKTDYVEADLDDEAIQWAGLTAALEILTA
jgi:hypothetical protein